MGGPSFDPDERPPALATWEWRAFAARFDGLEGRSAGVERRTDVYLLAPGAPPGLGLKLRGEGPGARVEVKRLVGRAGEGLERWARELSEPLPLLPFQVRYLTRALAPDGPRPVRPLPAAADLTQLLRDLRLGEPRRVVVEKTIEGALLDGGVRLERTRLVARPASGAAVAAESLSLDGPDEASVAAARAGLALPAGATVRSWPAWLHDRFAPESS